MEGGGAGARSVAQWVNNGEGKLRGVRLNFFCAFGADEKHMHALDSTLRRIFSKGEWDTNGGILMGGQ